ncbi:MAG: hypothetical protein DRP71_07820 [Verrucomicrobia bacterium]|nr:MAG: hypothetical protein DRP71_07820 [Verrucomicrobiota bacterium]
MNNRPNYETLRDETKFSWHVGATVSALLEVTGIPIKEFNLNSDVGIELYRKGRPMLREMFGEDVNTVGLSTPPVSYGHINCLGAELIFPDGGEVNHTKPFHTLEEGVESLKEKIDLDFATAGMTPFYLDYRKKMSEAFGEPCGFWFGSEGPITTAYTLRGNDVFYDPYDNPELFKEFLRLLTDSIVQFFHFKEKLDGRPPVNPDGGGMCDDISAMFSPEMWPEFVLPLFDRYYCGITTGTRSAHIEDLRPNHLPYLEEMGLVNFDPSVSPRINPKIIRDRCRVPFGWRISDFPYRAMDCQDLSDFVFQAVADGASYVFTHAAAAMCNPETVKKVHAFIAAAKESARMLDEGASREEIGECVSAEGKKKFWDHWPE